MNDRYIQKRYNLQIQALTKQNFDDYKAHLFTSQNYKKIDEKDKLIEYEGKDLEKFKDAKTGEIDN